MFLSSNYPTPHTPLPQKPEDKIGFQAVRKKNFQCGILYSVNPFSFFRAVRTQKVFKEVLAERIGQGYTLGGPRKKGMRCMKQ